MQLRQFVFVYYAPILSKLDSELLSDGLGDYQLQQAQSERKLMVSPVKELTVGSSTGVASPRSPLRPRLEDPKDPLCSRIKDHTVS